MQTTSQHIELSSREIPYFEQWLGVWNILPAALDSLVAIVSDMDLAGHLAAQQARRGEVPNNRMDSQGVSVITIEGTLQKHSSSMGNGSNSTVLARRAIRQANADDTVGAILLNISSPGGTSAGTQELFDEIVKSQKPVIAYVDDLAASAAYWVASGARKIVSNASGLIGSIGTYAVITDVSGKASQEGIKVHVIKAGDFKGAGVPGTEVSEEQLAETQRLVDSRNEFFLDGVALGRSMSKEKVQSLADGRVHSAKDALALGLIDAIGSFDSAFAEALAAASDFSNSKKYKSKMSIQELRAACPGADAAFLLSALESGASVADTANAWTTQLAAQLGEAKSLVETQAAEILALKTEVSALTAKLEAPPTMPSSNLGVAPLAATPAVPDAESAKDAYWSKVRDLTDEGKTRAQAMSIVNKRYPSLRESLVSEVNSR